MGFVPYCSCVEGNGALAQELIMLILREGCLPEPLGLVHGSIFGINHRLLYIVHLQPTRPKVLGIDHASTVDRQISSVLCVSTTPHQPSTCTKSPCLNMQYQLNACIRHIRTIAQCLWTRRLCDCGLCAVLVLTIARCTKGLTQVVVVLTPRADDTCVVVEMHHLSREHYKLQVKSL